MATATKPRAQSKDVKSKNDALARRLTELTHGDVGVSFCPDCTIGEGEFRIEGNSSRGHVFSCNVNEGHERVLLDFAYDDRDGNITKQVVDGLRYRADLFTKWADAIEAGTRKKK